MVEAEDLKPEEKALRYKGVSNFLVFFDFSLIGNKLKRNKFEVYNPGATQWIWHMVYGVLCYLTGRIKTLVGATF